MTRGDISRRVVADRVQWIESMIANIRELPVENIDDFFADPRNALAC